VTWDYEGVDVIYFLGQEGQYDVDIFLLLEDLLYKDIPLTFYVKIKNIMNRESVLIAWEHNGTDVKYLPCAFKGVYVLYVSNLPEDLLCEDIPTKFHVYNTLDYLRKMNENKIITRTGVRNVKCCGLFHIVFVLYGHMNK
jgi:hypothetical protein